MNLALRRFTGRHKRIGHVSVDDLCARAVRSSLAIEIHGLVAELNDRLKIVRHKDDRHAIALECTHPLEALFLKRHVADAQDLVDD